MTGINLKYLITYGVLFYCSYCVDSNCHRFHKNTYMSVYILLYIILLYVHVAIAVLKKHYYDILRNFPSDHVTALSALAQVTRVSDATVDKILSCSTSQESNREILDTLIHITAMDGSLAKFCNAVQGIVGILSPVIESLRNGKAKLSYIFMYVPYNYL